MLRGSLTGRLKLFESASADNNSANRSDNQVMLSSASQAVCGYINESSMKHCTGKHSSNIPTGQQQGPTLRLSYPKTSFATKYEQKSRFQQAVCMGKCFGVTSRRWTKRPQGFGKTESIL